MFARTFRATTRPIVMRSKAIEIMSSTEGACSTAHTSTAAMTPMVANGRITTRPSCGPTRPGMPTSVASASPERAQPVGCSGVSLELNNRNMAGTVVRLAALADLHCTKTSHGAFQALFARIGESADILLLAGDLTDSGLPDEARVLAQQVASLRVPIAADSRYHALPAANIQEHSQHLSR